MLNTAAETLPEESGDIFDADTILII